MLKRRVYLLFALCGLLFTTNVSAKEIYYVNDNGVSFSKEEYEFLSFMFWDGSQNLFTPEDYQKFIDSKIMDGEINSNSYTEPVPYATTVDTPGKTLNIVSSCSTNCLISVTATWKGTPAIKSYDVIGAYLENTSLQNTPTTTVSTSLGTSNSNELKQFDNGFGVSIALPKYGNNIVVNQLFRVSKSGTVYASYQHATKNISLNDSKNYTISKAGFGGVFNFSGTAANTYDRMNGVNISL